MSAIPLRLRATDLRALLRTHLTVMQAQAAASDVALTVSVAEEVLPSGGRRGETRWP
jgi:hypothetical protein